MSKLPSRLREGPREGLTSSTDSPSPNPSRKRKGNKEIYAATFGRTPSKWQIA